jgi:hypothetical protein
VQWKIPENKSAMALVSSLEKPSSDPSKWPATVNFKIKNAGSLIKGGMTEQDSKGKWKIAKIDWNESSTGPVPIKMESGKTYDAPAIFMALPGDKITDKIIKEDPQTKEKVRRFLNWGDVPRGSEFEAEIKLGKPWKTPMGITTSFEIVRAVFYPPAPKSTSAFAGKKCVEPTDEELLSMMEASPETSAPAAATSSEVAGYVPTFDEDEITLESMESAAVSSPVKESKESAAPGAPKKKRKIADE